MINFHVSNNNIFVWNTKDVCALREEHRIVGSLIGSYPVKPFQVETKWLPLQLMNEEATLLIEKGIAKAVSSTNKVTDADQIKSFYEKRDKLCEEQILLLRENRKKEILENADQIFEGKKRKLLIAIEKSKKAKNNSDQTSENANQASEDVEVVAETQENAVLSVQDPEDQKKESNIMESEELVIDKEVIIEAELNKVSDVSKDVCLVQLFTENPLKGPSKLMNWNFPSSEQAVVRYKVFKDLWEKNYYITPGSKFGGDFLVYEGDPLKYHALFIIVCKTQDDKFQGSDIVVYGRLGQQVKKTVVLATVNVQGNVEYISINWEHKMT